MREAEFWSSRLKPLLVRECQRLGLRHHFERVENVVAEGTPDVDYLIDGRAGKMELKYAARDPAHNTSQVLGKEHGLRRSQIVYAARHTWAGGRVWCVIGTPKSTWLIDLRGRSPEEMGSIATLSPLQLDAWAAWHSGHQSGCDLPLLLVDEAKKATP